MCRAPVRRLSIVGGCVSAFVLVDGLFLFVTGGLNSDATPVFPMFGGSFSANRSSGTSLLILGVMLAAVSFFGSWTLGRRLRAAERDDGTRPASGGSAPAGSASVCAHDD
jgi:hypothetical protein